MLDALYSQSEAHISLLLKVKEDAAERAAPSGLMQKRAKFASRRNSKASRCTSMHQK